MKIHRIIGNGKVLVAKTVGFIFLAAITGWPTTQRIEAAPNVAIWDTMSRLGDTLAIDNRAGWKSVPTDLLLLETNPPKASSDPGYYGREYTFSGDAVVENRSLAAVFRSAKGHVAIYAKDSALASGGGLPPSVDFGALIAEFTPLQDGNQATGIARCSVVRHAADEAVMEVVFSMAGSSVVSVTFGFDKTGILELKPAATARGFRLLSSIDYGVVPAFIGDDLIYNPAEYSSADTLFIPSQNLFLGLLKGEAGELVLAWPKGRQQMTFKLAGEPSGARGIAAIDFVNDGQSLYLAALKAPGIWHREALSSAYLEKDSASRWKRPFPAKWITQLSEAGVKTTFAFRENKGDIWRGVPGSYRYPVWFESETAHYYLGKKVTPQGESIVYFLEGRETPPAISTPVEILKAALGRPMAGAILDAAGRKLRTHHRRAGEGVRRACTCGCTEAIQAVFEAGQETEKKADIAEAVDDMIYFVERHVERIAEYQRFAGDLIQYLRAQGGAAPELKPYLDSLQTVAEQILQEFQVQKENMKSPEHVRELTRQTLALAGKKDAGNLKAYMELLKAWREMGGAQDYVVAQCHTITRKLSQMAGYGCARQAQAVPVAEEILKRCRQCLRNPDGYEIWADY